MGSEAVYLAEHEMRSLRRWLNGLYPGETIFVTRPTVAFDRPAFVLSEAVPRQHTDRGTGFGVQSDSTWQIEALVAGSDDSVSGMWAAKQRVAEISDRLLTVRRIPIYLYGWQYPPAVLEVLPAAGALSAGELSVIVTAVNYEDEESLGEAVEVTVAAGDAVKIWISPWPRQSGVAKEYRVYAGASGAELQEAVVTPADHYPIAVATDLLTLAGTGGSPPTSSVFFYRHMCVDSVETETLEHPQTDGLFNGYVRIGASVMSSRRFPFSRPVETISVSDMGVV